MTTSSDQLSRLTIPSEKRVRTRGGLGVILLVVLAVLLVAALVFFATHEGNKPSSHTNAKPASDVPPAPPAPPKSGEPVLTVSGYIIPRARIEISPRFLGTVKIINVKKGDHVHKNDIMVQLEDNEYQARLLESEGHVALAKANLINAESNLKRQLELSRNSVDSERALDDAKRTREAAVAEVTVAQGQLQLAKTYLDWCTIRAPINGTILEKLVDPDELVVPQSFGGTRGPSTALVSLADLNDLQVEIDVNEADLSKIHMKQRCRVSPEAYMDKKYSASVAEIAPEANRSKGTLQIKVQIENPDEFLTPELTAKVEFLAD